MNTFFEKLVAAPIFLAQGAVETVAESPVVQASPRTRFIWVGAILLIFLITAIVLIAYLSRKARHSRRHSHRSSSSPEDPATETEHKRRRHRKRRHTREVFPQNPTLAETGGLPPVRPDDQAPRF